MLKFKIKRVLSWQWIRQGFNPELWIIKNMQKITSRTFMYRHQLRSEQLPFPLLFGLTFFQKRASYRGNCTPLFMSNLRWEDVFLDQNYSVVAYCEFVVQENRLFFTVIEDIKYSSKRRQKNEKWIFFPFMFPTHKKPEWHVWKTLSWYQFCLLTLLIRLVRDLPWFTKNEQNRFDRAENMTIAWTWGDRK